MKLKVPARIDSGRGRKSRRKQGRMNAKSRGEGDENLEQKLSAAGNVGEASPRLAKDKSEKLMIMWGS